MPETNLTSNSTASYLPGVQVNGANTPESCPGNKNDYKHSDTNLRRKFANTKATEHLKKDEFNVAQETIEIIVNAIQKTMDELLKKAKDKKEHMEYNWWQQW